MSKRLENDGYVYPGQRIAQNGIPLGHGQGLTKREWFAGQALVGMLLGEVGTVVAANRIESGIYKNSEEAYAGISYTLADAMIAASKESQDD